MYYLYYLYYIYYYNWCIVIWDPKSFDVATGHKNNGKKFMNMSYLTLFQSHSHFYISITQLLIFIKSIWIGYLRYVSLQSSYYRISQSFYFWDYLKTIVYSTLLSSVEVLRARIQQVCQDSTYIPGIFER